MVQYLGEAVELTGRAIPDQKERERIAVQHDQAAWGSDTSKLMRVWDNIDEMWTAPVTVESVNQYLLRMIVLKCSECIFTTSAGEGTFKQHVRQTLAACETHVDAELMRYIGAGDQVGQSCSSCDGVFMGRKQQGKRHLEQFTVEIGKKHEKATGQYIQRYSLAPPVAAPASRIVSGSSAGAAPVSSQDERRPRQPSRRRRRGHRGGKSR